MITNNQILYVLKDVRSRFANPKNWTKGCYAKNLYGESVDFRSEEAVCWCLAGAVNSSIVRNNFSERYLLRKYTYETLAQATLPKVINADNLVTIEEFNDNPTTTHTDILSALDSAIQSLESER